MISFPNLENYLSPELIKQFHDTLPAETEKIEDKKVIVNGSTIRKYTNKNGVNKQYFYNSKKYNDEFRAKKTELITCNICGSKINYYSKSLHLKSKKCLSKKQ